MTTMTEVHRKEPELRTVGIELRDVGTNGKMTELHGRAVPYGVQTDIGYFLESFARGSLAKSAKESAAALPLLMFHNDRALPVGSARAWDDQADGLWGTWRLAQTREAQEAAELAHDGHLNFMSIRFQPIRSTWTFVDDPSDITAKDSVERHEARLIEVSLVSTPAYNDATVKWVRSFEAQRRDVDRTPSLDAWKTELDRLRGTTA
jgi:hypothetical protein